MKIKRVIFLLADTVRASNIGVYNNKFSTPNIDSLQKNGWVFFNTYASATSTDSSVTSIMSGNFPVTNGLINHGKHVKEYEEKNINSITLLPELLQRHGFKTYAVDWMSRWHKRGYDFYSGNLSHDFSNIFSVAYKFPFPILFRILDKISVKFLRREFFIRAYYALFSKPKFPYDRADLIVDKAIKVLKARTEEKLFLYLHFWDAHVPHTKPIGIKSYLKDNVENTYNAEIRFLDQEIGRFLVFLKKKKLLKDTLLVFTADHGEDFGNHGMPFNHENLYENVVKVPLIFWHQNLKSRLVQDLTQHVDILPTILSMLKIPIPKNLDGKDLTSGKGRSRDFVYFEDITHRKLSLMPVYRKKGIYNGTFKYIKTYTGAEAKLGAVTTAANLQIVKKELFNLKQDPSEKSNIFPQEKKLTDKMDKLLEDHVASLNLKRFNRLAESSDKLSKAKHVVKETFRKYLVKDIAIAWKGGKDTTVMMHIIKSIYGDIPWPVFFNDTTLEFQETYDFINDVKKNWNLKLLVVKHSNKELAEYYSTKDAQRKKELARLMKITALQTALKKYHLKGFMLGIRRDENPARLKEVYFSTRTTHVRIHPLLDWTEQDIWDYISNFGVPYNVLYDQGYRSIGEREFTKKVQSGLAERAGRDQEKEKLMAKLRRLGYW